MDGRTETFPRTSLLNVLIIAAHKQALQRIQTKYVRNCISRVYVVKEWKWNINLNNQPSQEISRASRWISQYLPCFGGARIESMIRQTISYTSDYIYSLLYLPKISLQSDNTHLPILLWSHLSYQHNTSLISNVARRSFANLQSVRLNLRHCTRVRFILFSDDESAVFWYRLNKASSGCHSQS